MVRIALPLWLSWAGTAR